MAPLPSAHLLQGTQRESARCGLPLDIAGIAAEAERLQVADVDRSALVPGHDVVHPQGPLMLIRAAALAAAPCPSEHPVFHRTADRASVAGAMGVAEGFCVGEAFSKRSSTPPHPVARGTRPAAGGTAAAARRVRCRSAPRPDQGVEPIAVAGDAVAGAHAAHHPFPRIRRAMSCAGAGLRRSSSSMSISGWLMGLMRIRSAI
jgi:hypothetical protein